MPTSTYSLIASNVLGSSAASVTFSAIPQTFTDLVLRVSARHQTTTDSSLLILFNSSTTSDYSYTELGGSQGTTSYSVRTAGGTLFSIIGMNNPTTAANTFSSVEIYIPNYTSSTNKPVYSFSVTENNATGGGSDAFILATSLLRSNTSTISSITLTQNFATGCSFYLYGIKNA